MLLVISMTALLCALFVERSHQRNLLSNTEIHI